jgi:hypothetical protein
MPYASQHLYYLNVIAVRNSGGQPQAGREGLRYPDVPFLRADMNSFLGRFRIMSNVCGRFSVRYLGPHQLCT